MGFLARAGRSKVTGRLFKAGWSLETWDLKPESLGHGMREVTLGLRR